MAQLPKRTLGRGLDVSCLGLGCMGMTAFYSGSSPVPKEECVATIRAAIQGGCTFLDTAELYNVGLTQDNNEQLIGARALRKHCRPAAAGCALARRLGAAVARPRVSATLPLRGCCLEGLQGRRSRGCPGTASPLPPSGASSRRTASL